MRGIRARISGSLWSAQGALLARATFTGESASGWQQVSFANPVAVSAGTTYLASYYAPNGHYALNLNYFTNAYSNGPLHALGNSQDSNGVYRYAAAPSFPDQTWQASNYWVDVVFTTNAPQDTTAPTVTDVTPAAATTDVPTTTTVTATFDEALNPTTVTTTSFQLRDNTGTLIAATVGYNGLARKATLTPSQPLDLGVTYTATVKSSADGVADLAGNHLATDHTWSFTARACPCSLWSNSVTPPITATGDSNAVELGVKFQADRAGSVTGVRFYKGAGNTGSHVGSLWSSTGTLLGRVMFTSETATGWQQASFAAADRDHSRHDLRRLLLRPQRPLRRRARLLRPLRIRENTVAGPRQFDARRKRRLPVRPQSGVPNRHVPLEQLLGRRSVPAVLSQRTRSTGSGS